MARRFIILSAVFFCVLVGTNVSASTLDVDYEDGTIWNIYNVATWNTTGVLMSGMSVTATLYDSEGNSFVDALTWTGSALTSSTYGWSLTMNTYTYNTWNIGVDWTLSNNGDYSLAELVFDGFGGDVVFDTIQGNVGGVDDTPGSVDGREIIQNSDTYDSLAVQAVYSNLVALQGTVYGDLYRTLTLGFSSEEGYLESGQAYVFSFDSDNVNVSVPEPATLLLMGIGLTGLVGSRRLRKKK